MNMPNLSFKCVRALKTLKCAQVFQGWQTKPNRGKGNYTSYSNGFQTQNEDNEVLKRHQFKQIKDHAIPSSK